MDYTLASLRNRVIVDKLDDDEFDTGIVDNFINDTQRDIFNEYELPFQEKIFIGTIPAGTTIFQLPKDLALLQNAVLIGVTNFHNRQMDWRDFFRAYPDYANSASGEPVKWSLYAGNVIFSRPTDREYTLNTFYIKKPTTLTSGTSVPEIPEEFSELLVLGAYMRILQRNEDFDLADKVALEYYRQLGLLVNRYGARIADGPIKMKNQQITR